MDNFDIENVEKKKVISRPKFLSLLCILTFIFTGLMCLSCFITPLTSDMVKQLMVNAPNYDETIMAENLKVIEAGWGYHMLTLVLTIGSMSGAIMMWKLKKNGFHVYAISNLALLFVPTLVLGIAISWFAIFFSVAFIGMYGTHIKFMR
ncbi:hypothetical protein BH10BAC1_BH10BAC1_04700 [soil metagenome]